MYDCLHPLILCFRHFLNLNMQAVYNYTYHSDVPTDVILGCSAENISLLNAEQCLYYRYGQLGWIKYIWAIGLLAAGQSSTMTVCVHVCVHVCVNVCHINVLKLTLSFILLQGTYAGQFVMEVSLQHCCSCTLIH